MQDDVRKVHKLAASLTKLRKYGPGVARSPQQAATLGAVLLAWLTHPLLGPICTVANELKKVRQIFRELFSNHAFGSIVGDLIFWNQWRIGHSVSD